MKILKILLVSIFCLFFTLSCSNEDNDFLLEDGKLSEAESFEIVNSLEFQNFMSQRNQFLDLVNSSIEKGCDLDQLKEMTNYAIESGDDKEFFTTIFGSKHRGNRYIDNLHQAQRNLFNTYPVLYELNNKEGGSPLTSSVVGAFYDNIKVISKERFVVDLNYLANARTANGESGDDIVCGSYWDQVKLFTCAGLCGASTAGAGAVLCGWACWCTFCNENSAVYDALC